MTTATLTQLTTSAVPSSSFLLLGKPNSGKTVLFNRLTGLKQKVSNFPGVTVEFKSGPFENLQIVDLPGLYSLNAVGRDEKVAVNYLHTNLENSQCALLCVLDATRLERSLLLAIQIRLLAQQYNKCILFVLNMMDELQAHKLSVDISGLEQVLKAKIIPISARQGVGIEELKDHLRQCDPTCLSRSLEDFVIPNELTTTKWASELAKKYGPGSALILKRQNRLDDLFLSSVSGGLLFILIMAFLFQAIFSWAAPFMDAIEMALAKLSALVSNVIEDPILLSFLNDALIGGVGGFLVFVPQIFMLTFIIGLLEDSGYLARASIICHRPLEFFGLSGKSFVPYLSGMACAIPAIMATRTIESPKKRLITILTIPLMACSARLPVYALLIALIVPSVSLGGGLINLQGLLFFAIYLFGIVMALLVSALLARFAYPQTSDTPFILELPPYRRPQLSTLALRAFQSCDLFIRRAGPVIFLVTVALWALANYPLNSSLENSLLGEIGKVLAPLFAPMGVDWKVTIAILTSFIAREVFVGTMGTLLSIENAEENLQTLGGALMQSHFSVASAMALLVFYAVAMQCASTLAIIKQETGSSKTAILTFASYTLLAYLLGVATYQVAQLVLA